LFGFSHSVVPLHFVLVCPRAGDTEERVRLAPAAGYAPRKRRAAVSMT